MVPRRIIMECFICICSPLKKYLSVRSHEFLPRKCWKFVSLSSEWVAVFSKYLSRAVSRFSRAQLQGVTVSTCSIRSEKTTFFSMQPEIVIVFDPVGSKKWWRWFPATGPLEKRETFLIRSWRKLQVIPSRGRPISNVFEAKAHANVLKGTFSTDCKLVMVRAVWVREVFDDGLPYYSVCVSFNYFCSRYSWLHSLAVQRCGSGFWGAASSTHVLVSGTKISPNFPYFCICGSSGWASVMVRPNCLKNWWLVGFCIVWMAFCIRDNHEMRRAKAPAPSDVFTALGIIKAASLLLLRLKKWSSTKDDE